MFNRNGDLEQKPAKTDDADAKSPERHAFDIGKTFKQAGDAIGKVQNDMIERLTNAHVKQQYVASVSPALANQYVRGRDIMLSRSQSGKSTTDLSDLSAVERKAIQTYQRLHSDLPSKIPFYNKETLANDLDRDIVRKARSQPVVKTDVAVEPKLSSRTAKSEVRSEKRAETRVEARAAARVEPVSKPNLKPDSKSAPKPETKSEFKSEFKSESKPELRAKLYAESRGDSKGLSLPDSKSVTKPDSPPASKAKTDIKADLKPQAVSVEKAISLEKATSDAKALPAAAPGNALLTSLSKNRIELESPVSTQKSTQGPAIAKGEYDPKATRNCPPVGAQSVAKSELSPLLKPETKPASKLEHKPESKSELKPGFKPDPTPHLKPEIRSELKSELKPTLIQTTHSAKSEICSERSQEKKILSPSSADHSKAPSVRLIPVSQSNIATAHRDGAISVTRQLSDRTACSSIRVIVKSASQTGSEPDFKPDALKTGKSSQQNHPSKLPNFDAKTNRDEPKANSQIESKPGSISDSLIGKPSISPKAGDPWLVNRADKEVPQEAFVDRQGNVLRGYRLKCQDADLKYITGPEIALSAIIALAGIAKLRTDQSMWQTDSTALVQNYGAQVYDTGKTFDSISNSNSNSTLRAKGERGDYATSAALNVTEHTTEKSKDESETSTSVFIRPKILVGTNDSLVSIAEQLFNDSGIAWLILQLNSDVRPIEIEGKTVVRLRSRQEIFIPVYQDIIDFQKTRTKEMSGHNLITVVEENQIDREIIDLAISPMLGQNSSNVDPLQTLQALQPLEIVAAEDE
ncbi:hypothetical protein KBF38_20745 [bacterium]|nr:hypothetical protein [bacterium]